MSTLLAIDPGSNKTGIAVFEDGSLTATLTITTKETDPVKRRFSILSILAEILPTYDSVASEAPMLLGANNNGMQKFLGVLEYLTKTKISFFHPMTVKKFMGAGKMDKLEMALSAGEMLRTDAEKETLARAISDEAFDETDAICVGLTYLGRMP